MYRYDEFDRQFVLQRTAQFRDQVQRRLAGELTEDQFKPLRLKNGLYLQLHAYMLRIAIPYGTLNSRQLRKLADIADNYDSGYGHFTTRQNLQLHWPELKDVPDILAELAEVEMHCIQTSGNCIRNVTSDHYAGVAADEVDDPRPWAELLRQWSTLHPEFSYLPRKFKIAVTGVARRPGGGAGPRYRPGPEAATTRAGLGFEVMVGGGLGRTPMIGKTVREFLPARRAARLLHGDHAGLQPLRPARQQVQGADQDPGRTSWAAGVQAPRSRPSTRPATMPRASTIAADELARIQRLFRAAGLREPADRDPAARPADGGGRRLRPLGAQQHRAAQDARLRHRQRLAEADRRHPGRRHRRRRCARWPRSRTSSARARSGSPTSRTWSCRTS